MRFIGGYERVEFAPFRRRKWHGIVEIDPLRRLWHQSLDTAKNRTVPAVGLHRDACAQ
ncbi:hypothetical protein D9M70_615740 [compost metagenome]